MHVRHKIWLAALAVLLAAGTASCRKDTTTPAIPQSAEQAAVQPTAAVQPPSVAVALSAATHEPAATLPIATATPEPTAQPQSAALSGPALVATVQALASQQPGAAPDRLVRAALAAVGLPIAISDLRNTLQGNYEVLYLDLHQTPGDQAEERARRAMLAAAEVSVISGKSWDGIVIDVIDKGGRHLLYATAYVDDLKAWQSGSLSQDAFIAKTLVNGRAGDERLRQGAATATAVAAITPIPANPSAITIVLADLPPGFQEAPKESLASLADPFKTGLPIQSRFGFTTIPTKQPGQTVLGFTMLLPEGPARSRLDAIMDQPGSYLDQLATALGTRGVVLDKKVLGGMSIVGDKAAGFKFTYKDAGGPADYTLVIFRRGSLLGAVSSFSPDFAKPYISASELARKLDDRAIEFQKNLVPHAGGQAGEEKAFS